MTTSKNTKSANTALRNILPYEDKGKPIAQQCPMQEGKKNFYPILHSEGHTMLLASAGREFTEKIETGEYSLDISDTPLGLALTNGKGIKYGKVTLSVKYNGETVPVALTKAVWYASSYLTRQIDKKHPIITLERLKVRFPLEEYARANGVPIDPDPKKKEEGPDAWEKEKNRAKNCLKTFRTRLKKNLENLPHITLEFTRPEGKKGAGDWRVSTIASDVAIERGYVKITFGEKWAEAMIYSPINYTHPAIFKVENKDPNTFKLGNFMNEHYMIPHNQEAGTYNRLKVSTLLKHTDLLAIDDSYVKKHGWTVSIKAPLEKSLDKLVKYGLLEGWEYVKTGGQAMTDKEAYTLGQDKNKWLDTVVKFKLKPPAPMLTPGKEE